MLKGWFDAFRSEGGPTLYSLPNRTPVTEDVRSVIVYASFSTVFVAFLIVFPGIRKEKFSTFISVTTSLLIGAVILASAFGSEWHVSRARVLSPHRSFSLEKISADISVKIGLGSVNVTLRGVHPKQSEGINYNERFRWMGADDMKHDYHSALVKGLPFPLLTVAEYFMQELEGFCWGRRYRLAGYYSHALLWSAFASWLLMNVLLCTVPRYGAYTMQLTGALMLACNALYAWLLPLRPLVIPFEGGALHFHFGWCYWVLMATGACAVVVGGAAAVVDLLFPHAFSTILEVDYDMPHRSQKCEKTGESFDNVAYESDEVIIDGKRAVSLKDFGKHLPSHDARHNIYAFTRVDCYRHNKDINIDLSAAALW